MKSRFSWAQHPSSGSHPLKGPLLRPPTAPREHRITYEIVVDAYTPEARALLTNGLFDIIYSIICK